MSEPVHRTREFSDNALLQELVGPYNANLARIEQRLGVVLHLRGNTIIIEGAPEAAAITEEALNRLYGRLVSGMSIEMGDIDAAARLAQNAGDDSADLAIRTRKRHIAPRTPAQSAYFRALNDFELVFALGPAGTGKTYVAVAKAVAMKLAGAVDRIILSRPAVEAGERLGFLPGDMREKVDPYLRPLYDALYEMLGFEKVAKLIERNVIEVAPLAYMRGRTLNNSYIILDESQNTTTSQMKMFLTRIGFGSTAVITGDVTQIDLPKGTRSGLVQVVGVLKKVKGISFTWFNSADVVRHPIVQRIVDAYDEYDRDHNVASLNHQDQDGKERRHERDS